MKIVFFLGVCGLCNRSINFLMKVDKKKVFKYSHLQGSMAQLKLSNFPDIDTVVFYDQGETFVKSKAVIKILIQLGGFYKWSGLLMGLVPTLILDRIYDFIARYRYFVFGKQEQCRLPTNKERQLFLD